MKRLTTRGIETARAIWERKPFTTSGSFHAESVKGRLYGAGRLIGDDLEAFNQDNNAAMIDYVVYSYATPIAWHTSDGRWHVVKQKFSPTTSKHQGNLYMIRDEVQA
jgi:hypothetical protein